MADSVHVRPKSTCAHPGCPTLTHDTRCRQHHTEQRRRHDRHRPNAYQRGYGPGHHTFRTAVLQRDPWCTCQLDDCHGPGRCTQPSTEADHQPVERRQLVRRGDNPNDPKWGKGKCGHCHSVRTGRTRT